MSTFDGIVDEFPHIRIDFFRTSPTHPPPLACFLSHIHSDHMQGLESLRAPYVYCSPATRSLILQLERYPNRINFARGILESRKQHYKHLKSLLRPIPLNCPTEVELGARKKIRVTLFDANHCPGAVMFLIEGDGKAVLYTGDVRAEPWWVNQLARNPILIPYSLGARTLDRIYLDTTFAIKEDLYREFPSKAEGINELLEQIQKYSPQTVFHFSAWTLGYEEVWQAMSALVSSQIHVDEYHCRLYGSLSTSDHIVTSSEAPILNGFLFGNGKQDGCLTNEQTARIHSCEPGTECHAKLSAMDKTVWIHPIITRTSEGIAVPEVGAGGGGGDLYRVAELDTADLQATEKLEKLCSRLIDNPEALQTALRKLSAAKDSRMMRLSLEGLKHDWQGISSLQDLVQLLASADAQRTITTRASAFRTAEMKDRERGLSNVIRFPYSRHSSYSELRHLSSILKPKDIYPCTVDMQTWTEERSIENLFGDLCSEPIFAHDHIMRQHLASREFRGKESRKRKREDADLSPVTSDIEPTSNASDVADEGLGDVGCVLREGLIVDDQMIGRVENHTSSSLPIKEEPPDQDQATGINRQIPRLTTPPSYDDDLPLHAAKPTSESSCSPSPPTSPHTRLHNIQEAYIRLQQSRSQPPQGPNASSRRFSYPRNDRPVDPSSPSTSPRPSELPQSSSPLTLSTSFFDSQESEKQFSSGILPTETAATAVTEASSAHLAVFARKAAYRTARSMLNDGAASADGGGGSSWELFATRSGGNCHTEAELEL